MCVRSTEGTKKVPHGAGGGGGGDCNKVLFLHSHPPPKPSVSGFCLSAATSFPLIVLPSRESINSLLYGQVITHTHTHTHTVILLSGLP